MENKKQNSVIHDILAILSIVSLWVVLFTAMHFIIWPSDEIIRIQWLIEDMENDKIEAEAKKWFSILVKYLVVTDDEAEEIVSYEEYLLIKKTEEDMQIYIKNNDILISDLSTHYLTYWNGNLEWKKIKIYNIKSYKYNLYKSKDVYDTELIRILDLKYNKHNLCFQWMDWKTFKDVGSDCNPMNENDITWKFSTMKLFCYHPLICDKKKKEVF